MEQFSTLGHSTLHYNLAFVFLVSPAFHSGVGSFSSVSQRTPTLWNFLDSCLVNGYYI